MALAGSFQFHTFADVLRAVGNQSGVMALRNMPSGCKLCIHLNGQRVQAVFLNGRPLRCAEQAQQVLREQLAAATGDFKFDQALPEDLRKGFDIPVAQLLPANETLPPKGLVQRMFGRFARG